MDGLVVVNQTVNGNTVQNVLGFNNLTTDPVLLQELADAIRARWASHMQAFQSTLWSTDSITVVFNDPGPVFSLLVPYTGGVLTGLEGGHLLPMQVSLLVSTSFFGPPPNRGRIYLGGFTENNSGASGLWTTTVRDAAEGLITDLANGIELTSTTVFLRIQRRDASGLFVSSSPVQGVIGRLIPAIQRRRRQGQGA